MRKVRGLKRVGDPKYSAQSPTPREWVCMEQNVEHGDFSAPRAKTNAHSVIRAIKRYDSASAKVLLNRLSETDQAELDHCIGRLGFEFDFPEPKPETGPKRPRKPHLKVVR